MADDFADMGRTLDQVLTGYQQTQQTMQVLADPFAMAPAQTIPAPPDPFATAPPPNLPPAPAPMPQMPYVPPLSAPETAAFVPPEPRAPEMAAPMPAQSSMAPVEMVSTAPPPMMAQPMMAQPMMAQPMMAQPMMAQPMMAQPMTAQSMGFAPMSAPMVDQGSMALFDTPNYVGPSAEMLAAPSQGIFTSQPVQGLTPGGSGAGLGQRPPDALLPLPLPYGGTSALGFDTFERIRAPLMFQRPMDAAVDRASEYQRIVEGRYDEYATIAGGLITSAVGGTIGTGLGALIGGGISGGSGAMTGANVGGLIGSLASFIPGVNEMAAAMFRPAIERRADAMQTQVASRRFLTAGQDVDITGTGLSTEAAQALTYEFDQIAEQRGLARRDVTNIAQAAGEQGLLDMANSREEIAEAVKGVTGLVGTLAEVTGDPDFRNNIEKIGQLRRLGFDPDSMGDMIRRADAHARAAGLTVDQAMQRGGLQGASLFQNRGLDAASGFETGLYSQGLTHSALQGGTFNERVLALYGGEAGVQQTFTDAMGAYSQGVVQRALLPAFIKQGDDGLEIDKDMLRRYRTGQVSMEEMVRIGTSRFSGDSKGLQELTQRSREFTSEIMQELTPEQQHSAMLYQALDLMESTPGMTLGSAFRAMGADENTANVLMRMSDPETLRARLQQQRYEVQRQQYEAVNSAGGGFGLATNEDIGVLARLSFGLGGAASPLDSMQRGVSNWLAKSEEQTRLAAIGAQRGLTGSINLTDDLMTYRGIELDAAGEARGENAFLRRFSDGGSFYGDENPVAMGSIQTYGAVDLMRQGYRDAAKEVDVVMGMGATGELQDVAFGGGGALFTASQALELNIAQQLNLGRRDNSDWIESIEARGVERTAGARSLARAVANRRGMSALDIAGATERLQARGLSADQVSAAADAIGQGATRGDRFAKKIGAFGAGIGILGGPMGVAVSGGIWYGIGKAATAVHDMVGLGAISEHGTAEMSLHTIRVALQKQGLSEEEIEEIIKDDAALADLLAQAQYQGTAEERKKINEFLVNTERAGLKDRVEALGGVGEDSIAALKSYGFGGFFTDELSDLSDAQRGALNLLTEGGADNAAAQSMTLLASMSLAKEGTLGRRRFEEIEKTLTKEQRAQLIAAQQRVAKLDTGVQLQLERVGQRVSGSSMEDLQKDVTRMGVFMARGAEEGTMQSLHAALSGRVALGEFKTPEEAMQSINALSAAEKQRLDSSLVKAAAAGDSTAFLKAAMAVPGVSGEGYTGSVGAGQRVSAMADARSTEELIARLEQAQRGNTKALEDNTRAIKYGMAGDVGDLISEHNPFS